MVYQRKLRENGEQLLLGGIRYFIQEPVGCGGSSVVYRALYQDGLNKDAWHHVLIKELYPYHPRGQIYRGTDGSVCCTQEAAEQMELAKLRFRQGNQVNLELLEELPSQTSGNLNSYEEYGTYYSVLALHGGRNLLEMLENEDEKNGFTLREAAVLTGKILDALAHFHKRRMLHLDISPDNVLILPRQALLIDYNSAWSMEEGDTGEFVFSEKQGYSAPEIRLRDASQVGYPSDLYSVCAVFFRMLAGRTLTERETISGGLKKSLHLSLKKFQKEPASAVHKAGQILWKGLHVLPRKRYQSIQELQEDIKELLDRIHGKGVSRSALWESSRKQCKKTLPADNAYLPQDIRLSDGRCLRTEGMMEYLQDGSHLLLKGPGGMGKSRLLQELWKAGVRTYCPSAPVVCYVSLKDYQEMPESTAYIQNCLLRELSFPDKMSGTEDARRELVHIFQEKTANRPGTVLLLDGLNEAGNHCGSLLKEIEMLAALGGVRILVTDRTDKVQEYGLYDFKTAQLLPLSGSVVSTILKAGEIPEPEGQNCRELLTNPMMLGLYIQTGGQQNAAAPVVVSEADDLVQVYLSHLQRQQLCICTGDAAAQLCIRYVTGHLLPQIAMHMQKQEATLLTFRQLEEILKKSYHDLQESSFGQVFLDYYGKSREMFASIQNESEWFDYAVVQLLMEQMGILVKTEGGYFGLLHDNFISCLAKTGRENAARLHKHNLQKVYKTMGKIALVCILLILTAGIVTGTTVLQGRKKQEVTQMAANQLLTSMGILNSQLSAQRFVMESVRESGILEGAFSYSSDADQLRSSIQKRIERETGNITPDAYREISEALEETETGISTDYFTKLCSRPESMNEIMQNLTRLVDYCLFEADYTPGQKADVLERYASYLDQYTVLCVYELYLVRCSLTGECREEFDRAVTYLGQMQELYLKLLDGRDHKGASREDIQSALSILYDTGYKDSREALRSKFKSTIGEEYASCLYQGEENHGESYGEKFGE